MGKGRNDLINQKREQTDAERLRRKEGKGRGSEGNTFSGIQLKETANVALMRVHFNSL